MHAEVDLAVIPIQVVFAIPDYSKVLILILIITNYIYIHFVCGFNLHLELNRVFPPSGICRLLAMNSFVPAVNLTLLGVMVECTCQATSLGQVPCASTLASILSLGSNLDSCTLHQSTSGH